MNTKKLSRRKFIAGTCANVLYTGLVGIDSIRQKHKNQPIIKRQLGKTGLKVPIVSMGVMNTQNFDIIRHSFDMGVRLFDTAKAYGNGKNESLLGEIIKDLGVRQQVIIQTKVLHPVGRGLGRSPEPLPATEITRKCIKEVESSLKRLQTDYIDILFYHAVDSTAKLKDSGVLNALKKIKKDGKARFLGISTHTDILPQICSSGLFDVVMIQLNFMMGDDKKYLQSIAQTAASGLGVIAMKTQGGNRLSGSIMNHSAALKWVLRHKWISTAIPGYTTLAQLKENFSVAGDLEYNEAEKKFLASKKTKLSMNFCRWCRKCHKDCPWETDVSTLMRVHMYALGYKNWQQANQTLETIPPSKGIENCYLCSSCFVNCPHSVDINGNIQQLKGIFQT